MQHHHQDSSPTGDQNHCLRDQDQEDQADLVGQDQDQDQEDQANLVDQAAIGNLASGPRLCYVGNDKTRRQDHDVSNARELLVALGQKPTEEPTLVQSVGHHNGGFKVVFYESICEGQA